MSTGEEIWKDIQGIVDKKASEFKISLDNEIHCMDVGIRALQAVDPTIKYPEKEKLHSLIRKNVQTSNSLEAAVLHVRDTKKANRTIFVEDPVYGDYILAPSYDRAQHTLSKILKSSDLNISLASANQSGQTLARISGTAVVDTNNTSTASAAKLKLYSLLNSVKSDFAATQLIQSKLRELDSKNSTEVSYTFSKRGLDTTAFTKILGTGTVLVKLQTREQSAEISALESKIESDISKYLKSSEFHTKLLTESKPKSIIDTIVDAVTSIFSAKPVATTQSSTKEKIEKKLTKPPRTTGSAPKQVKNLETQKEISLVQIKNLLNKHLQHVISANMGNGNRKDILNYRTGRFAASAQVQKVMLSREGMLSAFYTYMKYPYATFSAGGKQEIPRSRDPKLLIAGSIRDIAEKYVSNRMRAVLV